MDADSAPGAFMLVAASQTVQRLVSLLRVAGAQVKALSGSAIGTITTRSRRCPNRALELPTGCW